MQIQKKKQTNKKLLIITAVAITILALGYTGIAYMAGFWPFSAATQHKSRDDSSKNIDNTEDESNRGDEVPEEETTPLTDGDDSSTDSTTSYPDSPLLNEPDVGAPYPITNEHYQIKQNGEKVFSVTLYPIANNPEYTDYNAQLKAYKQEVLSYLQSRYGTTADLTITWSPEDAKAL